MSLLTLIGALAGAVLFGAGTWRLVSRTMRYRSFNPTIRPAHVAREDYDAWAMARRRRVRLAKVVGVAVAGALVGGLLATVVGAGLRRQ